MPELAEVELIRRGLSVVIGSAVTAATTDGSPRFVSAASAAGATISEVHRRGKWLSLQLSSGEGDTHLGVHLGMTGQLTLHPPAEPPARWRCRLDLSDGRALYLSDARGFGQVRHAATPFEGLSLGAEPGQPGFEAALISAFATTNAPAFLVLLEQHRVAGIGAYVAQEALWRVGIAPSLRRPSDEQLVSLANALVAVVADSIATGGMTMRDYRRLDGSRGEAFDHLDCYGRAGLPCRRCTTPLVKRRLGGRGVTSCPRCQQ